MLGLKHAALGASQKLSVMSTDGSLRLAEFQILDIAALQYLHGAQVYASGSTTYAAASLRPGAADRFWSIYDSSGTDLIDTSSFLSSQFIDLRPGHFSSVGNSANASIGTTTVAATGQDNLSIAFGTIIENAKGSAQADAIVGNAFSNILEGGEGDDLLYADGYAFDGSGGSLADADYSVITQGSVTATSIDLTAQVDELRGEAGNDRLLGSRGKDKLIGGAGTDYLAGGTNEDELYGGDDNDILMAERTTTF